MLMSEICSLTAFELARMVRAKELSAREGEIRADLLEARFLAPRALGDVGLKLLKPAFGQRVIDEMVSNRGDDREDERGAQGNEKEDATRDRHEKTGSVTVTVVPAPGALTRLIVPPCSCTERCTSRRDPG